MLVTVYNYGVAKAIILSSWSLQSHGWQAMIKVLLSFTLDKYYTAKSYGAMRDYDSFLTGESIEQRN